MRSNKSFNSSRKGKKKSSNYDSRLARDEIPRSLPALQDQLTQRIILRFASTTAFGGVASITYANLLDAWYIAVSATNAFQLFDFVRLKKVTIRGMGGARALVSGTIGSAPCATVAVEFPGLNNGQLGGGKQKSDTQLGYDVPCMVSLKPDPQTQGAQFQPTSGSSAFFLRGLDQDSNPLSSLVVDVEVIYRNSQAVNPAAIGTARAGMTTGSLYFNGLDGLPNASTAFRSTFGPTI